MNALASDPEHQVGPDELRGALEEVLQRHFRRPRRVRQLQRRRSDYSSSYTIDDLDVLLDQDQSLQLVLKDLSPSSLLQMARQVRPHFLYEPRREIETYERILAVEDWGTPVWFGAVVSGGSERYWLFLERVEGVPLWQIGPMEVWEDAARWLARMHTAFDARQRSHGHPGLAHLLRYDEAFFQTWMTRAEGFLRSGPASDSPVTGRRFARLAEHYPTVIRRLTALPATLIHGEYYPSNILVRSQGEGVGQICPVDWELAAIGSGLIDLAALTSGDWNDRQRERMVSAYRDESGLAGVGGCSLAELIETIDHCRLHLAIQLLGWASDWAPPEEHTHNWLAEALRLADRLGIG